MYKRQEYLELAWDGGENGVPAEITGVEDLGSSKIVTVLAAGHTLKVRVAEEEEVRGETVRLIFPPERTLLYNDSKLVSAHMEGGW